MVNFLKRFIFLNEVVPLRWRQVKLRVMKIEREQRLRINLQWLQDHNTSHMLATASSFRTRRFERVQKTKNTQNN